MRVHYSKAIRALAKSQGNGLIMISVVQPDGNRTTVQIVATKRTLKYAVRVQKILTDVGRASTMVKAKVRSRVKMEVS